MKDDNLRIRKQPPPQQQQSLPSLFASSPDGGGVAASAWSPSPSSSSSSSLSMSSSTKTRTSSSRTALLLRKLVLTISSSSRSRKVICFLLITILISIAIGISLGIYFYMRLEEDSQLQQQFDIHSHDILHNFRISVERKLNAIDTFATSITQTAAAALSSTSTSSSSTATAISDLSYTTNHTNSNEVVDGNYSSTTITTTTSSSSKSSSSSSSSSSNSPFPFVTIPNFATRGSTVRVLADALMIHWLPLVTDENRIAWEEYAYTHRYQTDDAFQEDEIYRNLQDIEFGFTEKETEAKAEAEAVVATTNNGTTAATTTTTTRINNKEDDDDDGGTGSDKKREQKDINITSTTTETETTTTIVDPNILQDGTGYHLRIYNVNDNSILPNQTGPYLPIWQRTPVNAGRQGTLNLDFSRARALAGVLPVLLQDPNKVIMNRVIFPIPNGRALFNSNIRIGQYRHEEDFQESFFVEDPVSFMAYPVFDTLEPSSQSPLPSLVRNDDNNSIDDNNTLRKKKKKNLVGVLSVSLYWRLYFSNVLPTSAAKQGSIICVIDNSFNQTFAYAIRGDKALYLGEGIPNNGMMRKRRDLEGASLVRSENVNDYIQSRAGPRTRGYTTVPLHDTYGRYQIHIYPSHEFEHSYITWNPLIYATVIGCTFLIVSGIIIVMLSRTLAHEANAKTERNLTDYMAHELRNPLGALDSALHAMPDDVIASSGPARELFAGMLQCTTFMTRVMNNLLDARQLNEGNMTLHPLPTSLREVLDGVYSMLEPSVHAGVTLEKYCYTAVQGGAAPAVAAATGSTTSSSNDNSTTRGENNKDVDIKGDWVYCDKLRLQQVLINVVSNATQSTLMGSITISVHWDSSGHNVIFTCEDTSPGIPQKEQERIFHRCVTHRGQGLAPGSGMGLAVAKHLIDLMDGTISLESDPTSKPGTKCVVSIPLETCEGPPDTRNEEPSQPQDSTTTPSSKIPPPITVPSSPPPPPPPQPILEDISILLVDDIKMNRAMLKRRLQKAVAVHCDVTEAATGEEALLILEEKDNKDIKNTSPFFDVIIMDQFMDGAGGILRGSDAVKKMRKCTGNKVVGSLIIGCSGNDTAVDFFAAGADLFWGKPLPNNATMIDQVRNGLLLKKTKLKPNREGCSTPSKRTNITALGA